MIRKITLQTMKEKLWDKKASILIRTVLKIAWILILVKITEKLIIENYRDSLGLSEYYLLDVINVNLINSKSY